MPDRTSRNVWQLVAVDVRLPTAGSASRPDARRAFVAESRFQSADRSRRTGFGHLHRAPSDNWQRRFPERDALRFRRRQTKSAVQPPDPPSDSPRVPKSLTVRPPRWDRDHQPATEKPRDLPRISPDRSRPSSRTAIANPESVRRFTADRPGEHIPNLTRRQRHSGREPFPRTPVREAGDLQSCSPSKLHPRLQAVNPAVSSYPQSRLKFCTATPAAPFTRLSRAERINTRSFTQRTVMSQ